MFSRGRWLFVLPSGNRLRVSEGDTSPQIPPLHISGTYPAWFFFWPHDPCSLFRVTKWLGAAYASYMAKSKFIIDSFLSRSLHFRHRRTQRRLWLPRMYDEKKNSLVNSLDLSSNKDFFFFFFFFFFSLPLAFFLSVSISPQSGFVLRRAKKNQKKKVNKIFLFAFQFFSLRGRKFSKSRTMHDDRHIHFTTFLFTLVYDGLFKKGR